MVYNELARSMSVAYVVGAGWDIRMSRELVISPTSNGSTSPR
jgi:hypothetical protein